MNEATKFAWAFLLTHGKVTNGKWCHNREGRCHN